MKNIKTLLESIEQEIKKTEDELAEEIRLMNEEEANAPEVNIEIVLEDMAWDDATFTVVPGDIDAEYKGDPAIQSILSNSLVEHAIDLSGFDLYMDTDYTSAVNDILEAYHVFSKQYNVTLDENFNHIEYKPSIKDSASLDEMAKEFYDALEKAYQLGL